MTIIIQNYQTFDKYFFHYRVRYGYAHVANNYYDQWSMYAIGGSANPTIFSEGNYFIAPDKPYNKEVYKHHTTCSHIESQI